MLAARQFAFPVMFISTKRSLACNVNVLNSFGTEFLKSVSAVDIQCRYYRAKQRQKKSSIWSILFSGGAGLAFCASFLYYQRKRMLLVHADVEQEHSTIERLPDGAVQLKIAERKDLPTFRLEEVKKHGKGAERIWVTCQCGVYDITDFIEGHPGGEKILMAAGDSVEPFWHLYEQHENQETLEMLEELRIGNLDLHDVVPCEPLKDDDDPYRYDPKRHPALVVNSRKPFNAETPVELLLDHFHTPNALFFVRNHMPVPKINAKEHRVSVEGIGIKEPFSLTVDELKKNFQVISLSATVQCAGNRRSDMEDVKPVQGLSWKGTAISNAKWTGVRLRDVLLSAGVDPNSDYIKHVQFEGADKDAEGRHFGSSISFEKAMNKEVLLAFLMNDEEIPLDHGFPVRLIAPGIAGVRHVKWLKTIRLSEEESSAFWQKKDYRALPPTMGDSEKVDYDSVPSIQEYPVQSAFTIPSAPTKVKREDEEFEVAGYAWSGGGRGIIRVEVSVDGGKTWQRAKLRHHPDQDLDHMWSWTFFSATVKIPENADHIDLVCKATDRAYNTQPETAKGIWNVRGLLHNAWHRIRIEVL